jgi:hypothetical protein
MKDGLRRLTISTTVIVVGCKLLGFSWSETVWTWTIIGFLLFILQAVFDFGRDVAKAMSREQHNYNITQINTPPNEPLHPDFTRPDSAREAYPAVITMRRERKAKS